MLIPTDLPEPVVPAINRCGIRSKFAKILFPDISYPKASVREALSFYKKAARSQNSKMNYHSSDTLALSILVEEVSGKSLATVFHDKIYSNFGKDGYMHWTADKQGTTVSFADLTMTARDWANFGKFLMEEKKSETCSESGSTKL